MVTACVGGLMIGKLIRLVFARLAKKKKDVLGEVKWVAVMSLVDFPTHYVSDQDQDRGAIRRWATSK